METVSVAKMRKALGRFESNSVYFDVLFGVMRDIATGGDQDVKEFIAPLDINKKLVVVVASDKGLCGSFNHDVLKLADSVIDKDTVIMPMGQVACDHFTRRGDGVDTRFVDIASSPDYGNAKAMADVLLGEYGSNVGSVKLVYMHMLSRSTWEPQALQLLPISPDKANGEIKSEVDYSGVEFEPSMLEVFKQSLPLYVSGMIYGALVQSAAAEHGARHAAMSASSENADDMIAALSQEYNSARQSSVTEQIIDIVGSAQAIGEV
ncbi:MAG: F0F1 ATP synthase subunit gamma, partial [Clostridiales bacterium]|nr:F0F1 ATP synthase subunit gamma [Clostridiales bacterium]